MLRSAIKVTVSIPPDLYRDVERSRHKTGKSRSAVMQDALRHWLAQKRKAALISEYEAGYRRVPETRHQVAAAEAAAVRLLASEEW